jgi:hypothetical protein
MGVEELTSQLSDLRITEPTMTASLHGVKGHGHTGLIECGREPLTLMMRHEWIGVAVADQERRIHLRHEAERIGVAGWAS